MRPSAFDVDLFEKRWQEAEKQVGVQVLCRSCYVCVMRAAGFLLGVT